MSGNPDRAVVDIGESFDAFVIRAEPGLKQAFVARFGRDDGVEAASETFAYAWEHWARISVMENPIGYLYRVGWSRTRRIRRVDVHASQFLGRRVVFCLLARVSAWI